MVEQHEPCVALDRRSPLLLFHQLTVSVSIVSVAPVWPVNRFCLNLLILSSFLLAASGFAFHLWSPGCYACRRGLISRVKVYWFLTRLRGGVVSYERFCLPLRVRCDEVKLLPVGDPTDPSGGRRGMANCSQQCPLQVLTIAN